MSPARTKAVPLLIAAAIGALAATAVWLVLIIVLVLPSGPSPAAFGREKPAAQEARLRQEAEAILAGGAEAWRRASPEGQQVACYTNVAISHPNDNRERQRMLGRLIWAQVDYTIGEMPGASFAETFSLIDAMDYQPRPEKR